MTDPLDLTARMLRLDEAKAKVTFVKVPEKTRPDPRSLSRMSRRPDTSYDILVDGVKVGQLKATNDIQDRSQDRKEVKGDRRTWFTGPMWALNFDSDQLRMAASQLKPKPLFILLKNAKKAAREIIDKHYSA